MISECREQSGLNSWGLWTGQETLGSNITNVFSGARKSIQSSNIFVVC